MKSSHICLSLYCLLFAGILHGKPGTGQGQTYEQQQQILSLRMIGHQLLLAGGDSTSRVLPIQLIGKEHFQIEFEAPLSFFPESLVEITHKQFPESAFIVSVYDCVTRQMVHGFEINPEEKLEIPCSSRPLEEGCYYLRLQFQEEEKTAFSWVLLPSGMLCALLLFVAIRRRQTDPLVSEEKGIRFGEFQFDPQARLLRSKHGSEALSDKESRLLELLALSPNQLIEREHLEDEIWGRDGVITGRSLDVFISRLRKKLQSDSSVQIQNQRGRGYQLTIRQ